MTKVAEVMTRDAISIRATDTIRQAAMQLQVSAVWRVIGPYAAHVRRVRVVAHRGAAYEEVGITFGTVTDRVLIDMTNSIASIPWVLDVWFCP